MLISEQVDMLSFIFLHLIVHLKILILRKNSVKIGINLNYGILKDQMMKKFLERIQWQIIQKKKVLSI